MLINNVKAAFYELGTRLLKRNIIDYAVEFTDMREVEKVNFLAIYLLGATRHIPNLDEAWPIAQSILKEIMES